MAAAKKTTKKKTPARKTTSKKKASASSAKTTSKKKTKPATAAAGRKTSTKKKKTVEKAAKVKKTTKSRPKKTTTKAKTRAAAPKESPKAEVKAPARAKPQKPAFDAEFLKQVRDEMVDERRSLLSMMQSTQQQLAGRDTGLADLSDIASGGFEDELAIGLMASEAATLEKIDAAIKRIDNGTYGMCLDCEKPIPKKRLEFLPFAQRCMECEGNRERRVRMGTIND